MSPSIRTRLTLGSLFLFALMMLSVVLGLYYLIAVDDEAKAVLADNYDSVRHIQGMQTELERDTAERAASITGIDSLLRAQERNITEEGEQALTARLRTDFEAWRARTTNDAHALHRDLNALLDLNLKAIARKSEAAKVNSGHALFWLFLLAVLITLIGLGFSVAFPTVMAAPIVRLKEAVQELAAHNYRHRIPPFRLRELDELAMGFNRMAAELERYDNSNLARLMTEKSRAEAVINTLKDASIGVDNNGTVLFANQQALDLLGVNEERIVGHSAQEVAERNTLWKAVLQAEKGRVIEHDQRYLLPGAFAITGAKGALGTLYMVQDITRFQERDRAKTDFLATISHELKTPLASSDIGLTLLEREGSPLNEQQRAILSDLRKDHQRLVRIVGELLDMAQAESGHIRLRVTDTSLLDVIQAAMDSVRSSAVQKNVRFDLRVNGPQRAHVDPDKAVWVLVNLLSNAVRHSPEGGLVSIGSVNDNGMLAVTVTDQGPGIPEARRASLFDRFAPSGDPKGTGLGLSIAREFMRAMGGSITLESTTDGASFTLRFPSAPAA